MNYKNQAYPKDEYMSGAVLYQYLHISKRKMKYLLENGYIPCINTGKKTHRYIVKRSDAEAFKMRLIMDNELIESIAGKFSSQSADSGKKPEIKITPKMSNEFKKYLAQKWADEPDAIESRRAAVLCGMQFQRIHRLCNLNIIFSVKIKNTIYCSKDSLIEYFGSIEIMSKPNVTKGYSDLIKEFFKSQ